LIFLEAASQKKKARNFCSTNPEGPLHLQLWTLAATVPSSWTKWKAAVKKFIVLGVPMTAPEAEMRPAVVNGRIHSEATSRKGHVFRTESEDTWLHG
jgi:NAD(P)H-dependent flavin oxidoreductase YrpB (nitropropane dioxygenase family)